MIVAEMFRRNRKMTRTTRPTVASSVILTSCTDSRIVTERSLRMSSVIAAGSCSRIVGSSALMRSTTSTTFVPGCLRIEIITQRSPVCHARRLVVLDAVEDVRDLVEAHGVAVAVRDDRRAVRRRAHQLAVRLHDEGLVAVDRARRQVRVRVGDGASRPRRCRCDRDASSRGSRSMRTANFCEPKTSTCATPSTHRQPLGDRLLRVLVDHRQRQRGRPQHEEDDRLVARVRLLIRRRRRHLRRQRARPSARSSPGRPARPRRCCGSGRTAA